MKSKIHVKRATKILLALTVFGGEILGYLAPSQFASAAISANNHGIDLATINKQKVLVEPFTEIQISDPDLQDIRLGSTMADIKVNGAYAGNALGFVDSNAQADRGWYYVDETEARSWVTQFGGNPDYVLTSSLSNVYRADVSSPRGLITTYKAYNLAELTIASGGHGEVNQDNLVQKSSNVDDYWKSVGNFSTTPRPTASVKAENPTYKVGQTVNIIASATDYSYYDRGIKVLNLSVINKTTGSGYKSLINGKEFNATSGQPGDPWIWNGSGLTYTPTEPGDYEISLLVQDLHWRTAQNSSSIDTAVPYRATFHVDPAQVQANLLVDESSITFTPSNPSTWADVKKVEFDVVNESQTTYSPLLAFKFATSSDSSASAVTATLTPTPSLSGGKATNLAGGERRHYSVSVSGLSSSAKTLYFAANINYDKTTPSNETDWTDNRGVKSISLGTVGPGCPMSTLKEVRIEGNSVTVLQDEPSGGSAIYLPKGSDRIVFTASKPGTFTYNGSPLPVGTGGNRYVGVMDYLPSNGFTVSFESDDGSSCWTQAFSVGDDSSTNYGNCKIEFQRGSGSFASVPSTINVAIGEKITFRATYTVNYGDGATVKNAEVYWKAKKPDNSIIYLTGDDPNDKGWRPAPFPKVTLPNTYVPPANQVLFDKGGEKYTIFFDKTEIVENEVTCEMSVEVQVNESCSITDQNNLNVNVTGELPSRYTSSPKLISDWSNGYLDDIYFSGFTKLADGRYDSHINLAATSPGTWYFGDPSDNKVIGTQSAANTPIRMILPGDIDSGKEVRINFISTNPSNCTFMIRFTIRSSNACPIVVVTTKVGDKNVKIGSMLQLGQSDFVSLPNNLTGLEVDIGFQAKASLWIKGSDGEWDSQYGGTGLYGNSHYYRNHDVRFPLDASGKVVEGEYMLQWIPDDDEDPMCDSNIFFRVGGGTQSCEITSSPATATAVANGNTETIASGDTYSMPDGATSVSLTLSVSGTLKVNGTAQGTGKTFTVTVTSPTSVVFEPTVPTATNCWGATLLPHTVQDCNGLYLNLYDETADYLWKSVQNKGTYLIKATKVETFGLWLSDSPTDYLPVIEANWTGTMPNTEIGTESGIYKIVNVPQGTYSIHGVVADNYIPAAVGCQFDFTLVISDSDQPPDLPPGGGGGNYDAGDTILKLFDTDSRELALNADGVWEREPTLVRVQIPYQKINQFYSQITTEINQKINERKGQLESNYSSYENVKVTPSLSSISDAKVLAVYQPAVLSLQVTGPGTPQSFSVSSTSQGGDYTYTGTNVPTETTWRAVLNSQDYKASINGFQITMHKQIDFNISYEEKIACDPDDDECDPDATEPKTASDQISFDYTILVGGAERTFEVFEPNAIGVVLHTPEWIERHAKDRYKSGNNQFYAGEAILTHIQFEDRHRHPVSGKYPVILGASAWMSEQGGWKSSNYHTIQNSIDLVSRTVKVYEFRNNKYLEGPMYGVDYSSRYVQNSIMKELQKKSLVYNSQTINTWSGPLVTVGKAGQREASITTHRKSGGSYIPFLDFGDVHKGLQRTPSAFGGDYTKYYHSSPYATYFNVQFQFGVSKGFDSYNKSSLKGHNQDDYKLPVNIVGNAVEWQSYRNIHK